ncbi:hypothetical protein Trco_000095 [Trichoderma cornu-damae]|uniref:Uncharacterized protein n=1 Tax=Trichoderma cornu-damae TaxID=654480 RepID=A0A9P8QRA8_9HYPO|nr:hypothetical protein Trco_000095 [Trichoderma cornu-damae]
MGGSAFASGADPLFTPRMPRAVYEATKASCENIIRNFYSHVDSPLEGPSKKDFGDIDFLVASPKPEAPTGSLAIRTIALALGAERTIITTGREAAGNLAIPWPVDGEDDEGGLNKKYIQIDVRICETEHRLRWMLFKHGHGDLWNIVGSIIRPYGLTVDDSAMWLRVPEIEESNRKRARIFLTSDPAEVLNFLELPMDGYWDKPFPSTEEMFRYATRCRLMYVSPTAAEPDAKKLKANDRRRMNYRPVFRKWVDEFLPECRRLGEFSERKFTRDAVTEEAFSAFGVEEEFNTRRKEFLAERQRNFIWNTSIKGSIPEPDASDPRSVLYRSCLVKALKRIILEDDALYGIVPERSLKDPDGTYNMEHVEAFIAQYQDDVGKAAIARHHANCAGILSKKQGKVGEPPS